MVASRYVKSSDWDSAIDILYGGALALLKAGQGGSGGDLGCFLVEVLGKAEKGCGTGEKGACESSVVEAKRYKDGEKGGWKIEETLARTIKYNILTYGSGTGKLLALLRAFPPNEPTKKRFVSEMAVWSGKAGEYPNGDPEIHHVAGTLFAEGIETLHDLGIVFGFTVAYSSLQKANHMTQSAISLSVPKILPSSLPKSSTNGTHRTNPTPPLSMLQEPSFPTS